MTVRDLWNFRVRVAVETENRELPVEFLGESHRLREAVYDALRQEFALAPGASVDAIPPDTQLGELAQARFKAWQAYLREHPAFADI